MPWWKPKSGLTDSKFLSEEEVHEIIQEYMPDDTLELEDLAEWMGKDGFRGPTKRKQKNLIRKRGRLYNVVKPEYRDFTWANISLIQQYRVMVKSSFASFYTIGYSRKSPTPGSLAVKLNSINLQIMKLKTKLLCEHVFISINTAASDPIAARDHNDVELNLDDCSGNTQAMIKSITNSVGKVRLVIIDYRGLSINIDDLYQFIKINKNISELVVNIGHTVEVYSRHDLLYNGSVIGLFRGQTGLVRRSAE